MVLLQNLPGIPLELPSGISLEITLEISQENFQRNTSENLSWITSKVAAWLHLEYVPGIIKKNNVPRDSSKISPDILEESLACIATEILS